MPESSERYDVFISYSHHDADWVLGWLLPRLKGAHLRTCIDVEDFDLGAPPLKEMERAVRESRKTVLVLTPRYLASEWTEFEAILTQTLDPGARRRRVIPILLETCDLPLHIRAMMVYADLTRPEQWDFQLTRVIAAIRNQAAGTRAATQDGSGLRPLPPQPDFAHPYPLQEHFTGRVGYRRMLTEWLLSDNRPILCMTAMGGTGKSALTWAWVQRDVLGNPLPGSAPDPTEIATACRVRDDARPEGVLWWSFYERESTFSAFLSQTLPYASGGHIRPADIPSDYEKARAVLQLLQQHRFLLVLDGFERQLRAYASLSAAYQGDVITEDARGDYRSCTDPHGSEFLRQAASLPLPSRILLTSRLSPQCLDGLAGCRHEDLTSMDLDEAFAFLHAHGISATRAEVEDVCKPYGYHPLSLRLLAGLIVSDKRHAGDIQVGKRHPILPELKGKEQHHILQVSYDSLDRAERKLLSSLAAFRSPMTYEQVAILNPYRTDDKLETALDDLIVRGLLLHDRAQARYDLHPVVRQHAYDRLADKQSTHTRLRDYFANVPQPDKIESLDNLAPTIELYHHTVNAGRYEEAFALFYDRLNDPLYYRFGAYLTFIELLGPLVPRGGDDPPRLKSEAQQGKAANDVANSYVLSGQPRRAEPLYELAFHIAERQGHQHDVAVSLGNLATTQLALGRLADAEQNLRRSIDLCRETKDGDQEAVGSQELGLVLLHEGAFDDSESELATAQTVFDKIGPARTNFGSVVRAYRAHRALLMGEAGPALQAARRARSLAEEQIRAREPNEQDQIRAEWLIGAALAALAAQEEARREEHLIEAESHLTDALTRCRRISLVEFEPDILLAWAKWHNLRGDPIQARQHASEALRIADRCEYRLKQADCHSFLAALSQQEADTKAAVNHARTAYERAWCDGPPHCYKPALDEAERLLRSLGAEPPRIP
jgi:tetratricopeptide (TPR) repeat protein